MFTVKSSYGRGWIVTKDGIPCGVDKFDYRSDAQTYVDMRNKGYDHVSAWNQVYREGKGGQAGDNSMK